MHFYLPRTSFLRATRPPAVEKPNPQPRRPPGERRVLTTLFSLLKGVHYDAQPRVLVFFGVARMPFVNITTRQGF